MDYYKNMDAHDGPKLVNNPLNTPDLQLISSNNKGNQSLFTYR